MDRQDPKKYPKILESKNTYLRIRAPEHLDIALEGLIRKVLKEQPNMDDIYTFAADYFDTLLKIREASGVKKFLTQNLCPFHYDEDADEMIKLASTFTKREKEPKCISKKYKTLTLKDSDIRKIRKNSVRTISRNDVKINNTKNDGFDSLNSKSINLKSDGKNEDSEDLISETTNLMNLKQCDSILKENELSDNLDQATFAKLNHVVPETDNASCNSIQSADETDEGANESKHSQNSPKNNSQSSEEEKNQIESIKDESGFKVIDSDNIESAVSDDKKFEELYVDGNKAQEIELSEPTDEQNIAVHEHMNGNESLTLIPSEKEFSRIKDFVDENNLIKSQSQPNDETNLNSSNMNEDMTNDIHENEGHVFEKDSDAIIQTVQDQEQEANNERNLTVMERATGYVHFSADENVPKREMKVIEEEKTLDDSDCTITELTIEKSLELNQNKNKKEDIGASKATSFDDKLLSSDPITSHRRCVSDVQRFIDHEKRFSSAFKECDKVCTIPDIELSLHEKNDSETKKKDSGVLIVENEDINKEIFDSVRENEEISLNVDDVTDKIIPLEEVALLKTEDGTEDEDENIEDPDVDASTTSNEFEFEVHPIEDPDTLISKKQDDSDLIDEEFFTKNVIKSTISKTDELTDTFNRDHKMNDEAQSSSFDLEHFKNRVIEMFEPDIFLRPNADKSDKARIEKGSDLTSEKQIESNNKFLEIRETILDEHVMRKAKEENMKILMKVGNKENCQANDDKTNRFSSDKIVMVNGKVYKKAEQVNKVELNEGKSAKTEQLPERQNIENELIQTSKNIRQIDDGRIEEDILQIQLTTIIEAEINENNRKNLIDIETRPNIESVLEVVVDAGLELHKKENKELETIKLIKAATTIQSGFRRFQKKKISTKLGKLDKDNIIDAPNKDCALLEEKLKSDLPAEILTTTNVSAVDFKLPCKNVDMKDKAKNLSRSVTKPVLGTDSLDTIKRISLQRTKSLTAIRSGRDDFEVWNQLILELEEAATKIQSNYRRYKARNKLRRENAVQLTTDSMDSAVSTLHIESQETNERSTGEFHDSIVLSIYQNDRHLNEKKLFH